MKCAVLSIDIALDLHDARSLDRSQHGLVCQRSSYSNCLSHIIFGTRLCCFEEIAHFTLTKLSQKSDAAVFSLSGGIAFGSDSNSCVGVVASICSKVLMSEGTITPYVGQTQTRSHGEEHTTSATLSFSFEYTTSDDIEKAGNRSDMFLTPSLNVKFAKSAEITFDKASCAAGYKEIVTWSLDSETNVPVCRVSLLSASLSAALLATNFSFSLCLQVFSWRSVEDVQTIIIPFLDGVMEIEQAIVATSTNQTAKDESSKKIVQLTEAKNGWQSLLDRNWKLYQDARAGKLKTGVTHLVAEALLQDSNGVDNVKYINGSQAPNADALRAISAIRSERIRRIFGLYSLVCVALAVLAL